MKVSEMIALAVAGLIALIVIFGLQPWLLGGQGLPLSLSSSRLDRWGEEILMPCLYVVFCLGVFFSVLWIGKAFTSKFTRTLDVLNTEGLWWLYAVLIGLLSLLTLIGLTFFQGWFEDSRNLEPFFWLLGFLILDVLFIYWLPTAIATPKSMRYVPPGSMLLRKIYGG
jgi:type IV secretory pathway TrbD component